MIVVVVVPYGARLSICVRRSKSNCSGVICTVGSVLPVLVVRCRLVAFAYVIGLLVSFCVCLLSTWSASLCTVLSMSLSSIMCWSLSKVGPLFQVLKVDCMFVDVVMLFKSLMST